MSEELMPIEVIEGAIVPVQSSQPITLFGTSDPDEVLARAAKVAKALANVIKQQGLFKNIGGKEHVQVEGWTLLGSMLGVFPQIEWTHKLEDGWEARAVATVAATGRVVGAGEAQCTRSEGTWKQRDDFALRGMAQTRAISRAMRGPLGFVVQLAGFASTPAEEMPEKNAATHEAPLGAGTVPPPHNSADSGASSPAPRTPTQILNEARTKTPQTGYADEDAVCPDCGRKEHLARDGSFCAKAKGGCGWPKARGGKGVPITFGEFRSRQK